MTIAHRWDLSPREAIALQLKLAGYVETRDRLANPRLVAGVDVGFEDAGRTVRAAVASLSFPGLQLVEEVIARRPTTFPYVPGLLSFRELPAVLAAMSQLRRQPGLLLCDGHGYAHPRRFGIACHLGLLTDIPSIGVGKTRLIGSYAEPGPSRGDWAPLVHRGETIGAALRTRTGVKPIFVSIGHRISLETAIGFVLDCTTRYKLPETTRAAHRLASGSGALQPSAASISSEGAKK